MQYSEALSQSKKAKAIAVLVQIYGNVCWYCKMPFQAQIQGLQRTIDHLNDDPQDNRIQNLCLAHDECNQKKRTFTDWKILAMEQLTKNLANLDFGKIPPASEGERDKKTQPQEDELTEGEINRKINETVDAYLNERLPKTNPDAFLFYMDSLNSITCLVQKDCGNRGGQLAVRRSLDAKTSSVSDFIVIRDNGRRIIRRRFD